jgi:hypothetical protein
MLDLNQLKYAMPKEAWQDVKSKMYRHTRGVGMGEYLRIQRPSEPREVLEFRIKTLHKLTKDVFRKGLNNSVRMLLETPLLLDCNAEVKQLVESDNFDSHSGWTDLYKKIVDHFQDVIEDPNGMLVVLPINGMGEQIEPSTVPENERVYFYIDYVSSDNVVFYSNDMAIFEWKGRVFQDTKDVIFELKKQTNGYIQEVWYVHNTGHKLSTHLGGYNSSDENNRKFYDSFFDGAVEFADAFVNQFENLKAEMLQNSFPLREFREMTCNTCKGKGRLPNEKNEITECQPCNGSGKIVNFNTNSIFFKPKRQSLADDTTTPTQDPLVTYYAPPMTGTELNYRFSFDLYDRAGEAIGATVTKMAQSGVAKEEDKESYYSMLAQIMQNTVRLYHFSVSCIQSIWANDQLTSIKVTPSKDIRLNSQSYILSLVNTYKDAGVPAEIISTQLSQLVSRNTNTKESIIIKLLPLVDTLYGKSMQDIVMLKSMAGSPVSEFGLYVHLNAYRIMKQIEFQDKSNEQIISEFNELAKSEFDKYKSDNPTFVINEFE